ncbi:hypothetical protein FRE64_01985 [Euhalothece natronophila Z-M001]|uniref:DUF7305 domain-containing protein n=1 Tax=Euhalothece natronophila Z-M001 TaxID=522448 RepID=A0A5B8NJW0_9CHRO|nr:pilus assembly PilX N-terminal domain-containing protein [Euhalothece natronophila]QDZ38811.1 hypothetical protein FRE64_01985 [Euhalothece natronophila Z-M001]
MNNKALQIYLKVFSLSKSGEKNQGFVLPMMIGLGLIMTLVGLTMIGRSSDEQMRSISQAQTSQALASAETGVTRVMNFLNNVRPLANRNLDEWENRYDEVGDIARACGEDIDDILNAYTGNNWIDINNGRDRFRVNDYQYLGGEGLLSIEAQANFNQNPSSAALDVTIPVQPVEDGAPGLYVNKANLSNNQIEGNLLLRDCDLDSEDSDINLENIKKGDAKADPLAEFPPLPKLPDVYNEFNNGITSSSFSGNDRTLQLPRSDDKADANNVYHYLLGTTGGNNGNSINLRGGGREIIITPGEKVRFYLQGNVDMKGNARLIHDCDDVKDCKPENFQIYGGDGSDTYKDGKTKSFCLSGGSTVDAFIFAPEANVAVNGGANNEANDGTNDTSGQGITGSVWAKSWNQDPDGNNCGSNTGKVLVTQNADWTKLDIDAPRRIAPATRWERKSVEK